MIYRKYISREGEREETERRDRERCTCTYCFHLAKTAAVSVVNDLTLLPEGSK